MASHIADALRARRSVTALCALSGVSRPTGDHRIDRDLTYGPQGREARSRRPSTAPHHTPDHGGAAILDARRQHPSWGAKQLWAIVSTHPPRWPWPARSTGGDMRSRHGLGPKKRPRRARGHPAPPTRAIEAPHDVWSADFPGPFKTGHGPSGDPRTMTDGDRRLRRRGPALSSPRVAQATPVCLRVCNECGVPRRIRTDHGVPFAPNTRARRSQWSAWGGRWGILPACMEPGPPPQNGRHERRPRTLKADTTRPPGANLRAQQPQFNDVREECNHPRPPEALDRRTPAACAPPAPRGMPTTPPPRESPDRCEGRDVRATGGLRWHPPGGHVSTTGAGEEVGREESHEGVWHGYCGPRNLGRRLTRYRRSEEASGRLTRHR